MNPYVKTEWLNRSDPSFDPLTSPEVDADNLNKIEDGIYSTNEYTRNIIRNLSTAFGEIQGTTTQDIPTSDYDVQWTVVQPSNDTRVLDFHDVNKTISLLKPGPYNFSTSIMFSSSTGDPGSVFIKIVDTGSSVVLHTEQYDLTLGIGENETVVKHFNLIPQLGEVPRVLKIVSGSTVAGFRIKDITYELNTFVSGLDATNHASLSGTSDPDCHPISAITGLEDTISGNVLTGEAI